MSFENTTAPLAPSQAGDQEPNRLDTTADVPVPGTQHILELQRSKNVQHNETTGSIILIPAPSQDPNDPLNWSGRRKALATVCWCLYTLFNGFANSTVYSVLVPFSKARGLSVSSINAGTGYLFLLAGWGLLFWQPFALQYGKRPTYIITMLALVAISVWSPYCSSSGQWYARSILSGFFASPIEALPELSVTDLYFAHERGKYMGLYAFMLVNSNFLAPLLCSFINDGQGWRWVFYWPAIFCAVTAIFLFFFMEETNYDRSAQITTAPQPATISSATSGTDKTSTSNTYETPVGPTGEINARTKTYPQKLALKDKSRPFAMHRRLFLQLRFLTWPVPVYAGFAYGSTLIWFNVLNATASLVLGSEPYNFRPAIVGLAYIAPIIGVSLGLLFVGPLSDALVLRLARRNNGVMEPEQRLWLFTASTAIIPTALLVWGVGSVHHVQWVGLLFAMAMLGFTNTCGASLSVNYLVDCYREMSGTALTAVIIVRNTMSFAIGYGITPWINNMGRQNAFISAACIGFAASLSFLLAVKWGKACRRAKAETYWRLVHDSKQKGFLL